MDEQDYTTLTGLAAHYSPSGNERQAAENGY